MLVSEQYREGKLLPTKRGLFNFFFFVKNEDTTTFIFLEKSPLLLLLYIGKWKIPWEVLARTHKFSTYNYCTVSSNQAFQLSIKGNRRGGREKEKRLWKKKGKGMEKRKGKKSERSVIKSNAGYKLNSNNSSIKIQQRTLLCLLQFPHNNYFLFSTVTIHSTIPSAASNRIKPTFSQPSRIILRSLLWYFFPPFLSKVV